MSKQFNQKYMHPTRRKLVDMVHTGVYEKNIQISLSNIKKAETIRKIGEQWVDEGGQQWEQRQGYKVKVNKLTEIMSELRNEIYLKKQCKLKGSGCDLVGKPSFTNKKLIEKTGYCSGCLAKLEHPIRMDGLYTAYENFKIMSNMIKEGTLILEQLRQAYSEAKQEYEYVNADGKSQKWSMERDVNELKEEIQSDIQKMEEEVHLVILKSLEVYDLLKDRGYVLVEDILKSEDSVNA
jgi:hypothetical protein